MKHFLPICLYLEAEDAEVPLEQVEVRENATGLFLAAGSGAAVGLPAAVAWMGLGSSRSSCCWH